MKIDGDDWTTCFKVELDMVQSQLEIPIFEFRRWSEVWGFENGSNTFMEPILPKDEYAYGIALFVVNPDFCKK